MKINIELNPDELADFFAILASDMATFIRRHEEAVIHSLVQVQKNNKPEDTGDKPAKSLEDLYHGYTH